MTIIAEMSTPLPMIIGLVIISKATIITMPETESAVYSSWNDHNSWTAKQLKQQL